MKKQIHFLIALFFSIVLLPYACKKDNPDCPPDLPCATQSGENTFGCYINGKPWVAEIAPYIFDPSARRIDAIFDEPNYGQNYFNAFQLTARRIDSLKYEYFKFTFSPIFESGIMYHDQLASLRLELSLKKDGVSVKYSIDTISAYNIEMTKLDSGRRIASCVFSCKMLSSNREDTIALTNGRFDVRYNPE